MKRKSSHLPHKLFIENDDVLQSHRLFLKVFVDIQHFTCLELHKKIIVITDLYVGDLRLCHSGDLRAIISCVDHSLRAKVNDPACYLPYGAEQA